MVGAAALFFAFSHAGFSAQKLFITSFQPNGQLTWTNAPGTNAFAVQWTPNLISPWANAAPPLDLTVSTGSQTTVSAPIIPQTGFYRVVEGFGPQSLHGAWIIPPTGVTNVGQAYFMADGNGTLTNFGAYNLATPPGYYSVSNTGGVTMTVKAASQTNIVTGQFMPPRQIVFAGSFGVAMPVENVSLCAGTWSGTLSETNDPNGLSDYSVSLTVATNGSANLSGDFSGTGWMFALAPTNGALAGFFHTSSSGNYDQFRITGTLSGNAITGSFDTDSGSGANAIDGIVTLNRALPTVVTGVATSPTTISAMLNGTVTPNGADTTAWFQYGTTTNYGLITPTAIVSGTNTTSVTVSNLVSGLSALTLYHFQLVGTSIAGTTNGADQTFSTP
ncbi:MAG TPA: hypothetical protein VN784_13910 [Candidatus Limnocylindrales bacterium]|nr:hypothetical protein [Candidatus Limnocylindrales bacterium]